MFPLVIKQVELKGKTHSKVIIRISILSQMWDRKDNVLRNVNDNPFFFYIGILFYISFYVFKDV